MTARPITARDVEAARDHREHDGFGWFILSLLSTGAATALLLSVPILADDRMARAALGTLAVAAAVIAWRRYLLANAACRAWSELHGQFPRLLGEWWDAPADLRAVSLPSLVLAANGHRREERICAVNELVQTWQAEEGAVSAAWYGIEDVVAVKAETEARRAALESFRRQQ